MMTELRWTVPKGRAGSIGLWRIYVEKVPVIMLTNVVMMPWAKKNSERPSCMVSTLNGAVSHSRRMTNTPAYKPSCTTRTTLGSLSCIFISFFVFVCKFTPFIPY